MVEDSTREVRGLRSPVTDATGEPMMIAKFRAELGPLTVIRRQRLLDLLSDAVRRQVTLITAPAGSGKTTLAGSWASAGLVPGALTWISLDDGDERAGVFWSYVLEGLSRSGVSVSAVAAPVHPEAVDQSFLVRLSAALYRRQEPAVVVLDDADWLASSPVLDQIDFLLRHCGPQLRVVLITRVHPGLALRRHRLAGLLTEIGLDDLAFTEDEARMLLRARGVILADDALAGLMGRTRGWATGLVLAATSARHRPDAAPAVTSLAVDRGELDAYFRAEVLGTQPPDVRRFLLRTSIVAHLRPALADQLIGRRDADRMLPSLVRANVFLEACSQHDDCYRYHPQFAELLRAELGQETPAAVVALHRKAAKWLRAEGSLTEGIRHATEAGDWTSAASFLLDDLAIVRLLVGPDVAGLAALLARMPEDADGPETAVVLAALAIGRSDVESCAGNLARLRKWEENGQVGRTGALALTVALVELVLARTQADVEGALSAAATVEAVLDELAADGVAVPAGTQALVLFNTGGAFFSAGLPERAATTLAQGLRAAHGVGCEHIRAACLGLLALVEAVRGRLAQAAELGCAANTLADGCGLELERRPPAADVALAWVYAEACDASSARVHAKRAAATVAVCWDPVVAGLDALVRASLLRTAGDLQGALSAIGRAREQRSRGPLPGWLDHRLQAAAAAIQVIAGRPEAAISSIRGGTGSGRAEIILELARAELALGKVDRAGVATTDLLGRSDLPVSLRVDGWLLQASCALERGGEAQARAALDHALGLAGPEKMRRPFVEASPRLRRFIRRNGEITTRHAWLGGVANGASNRDRADRTTRSTPEASPAPVIVETLTEKEQEVLGYLAALLSTEEIAMTMFVSVNTVKTHVRGILRKLAASRRNEAVRRARELRLI